MFTEQTKDNYFDDLDDDEFRLLLARIKLISSFFDKKPSENVFMLLAKMSKYILSLEPPEIENE